MKEKMRNNLFDEISYKVGELSGQIEQIDKKLDTVIKNHEDRINKVEEDCIVIKTKAGIIGGITGFIVSVITIITAFLRGK